MSDELYKEDEEYRQWLILFMEVHEIEGWGVSAMVAANAYWRMHQDE